MGTVRSPASNFASAGATSPMVATRMVSDRLSVDTPKRTANSRRWVNSQLRAVEGGRRYDIRNHRQSPHLSGELGRHVRDRGIVLAGDDQVDVSLSIVVEEPVANIRYVCEVLADRVLELLLRE